MIDKNVAFAVPGDLSTATGGYGYDRKIMQGLRELGWKVEHIALGDGFPWPNARTLRTALQNLSGLNRPCPIIVDGLAFGVMPEAAAILSVRHPLIALVHHPLALETGLSDAQQLQLRASEKAALRFAHQVIVTSPATAGLMSDFGVDAFRVTVIVPGTEVCESAMKRQSDVLMNSVGVSSLDKKTLGLLAVGTVTPRKGFDVLVEALAKIKTLDWHLTIVGDDQRDPIYATGIRHDIARFDLGHRISLVGTLTESELAAYYQAADVFVLASRFEGYGMAYAEAMAYGLPVIGTTAGAIVQTVPSEAGLLVSPDDVNQLAQALTRVLTDTTLRERLSMGAQRAALKQPNWRACALAFEQVLVASLA